MNNYITLDGKRYKCPHGKWAPIVQKMGTFRYNLDGTTDATYGPATAQEWLGEMIAQITPDANYGSVNDLAASLAKRQAMAFVDHESTSVNVHALEVGERTWLGPKWDSPGNECRIPVRIIKA